MIQKIALPRLSALCALFAFLAVIAAPATSLAAVYNGNFEKQSGSPWKQWPRGLDFYHIKQRAGVDGSSAAYLQGPGDKHSHTLYQYPKLSGGGVYKLSWQYAVDLHREKPASDAKATVQLLFNKPDGGNGSAGQLRSALNLSHDSSTATKVNQWHQDELIFVVPPEANKAQLGFGLAHITGGLWLDNVRIERLDQAAVHKSATAPVIDGQLNDAVWQSAQPLEGFWKINSTGANATTKTTAYLAWGEDAVYVAFRNEEPNMDRRVAKVTQRDGAVWSDDSVEVFIVGGTDARGDKTGVHLLVNSNNVQTDLRLTHNGAGDRKWDIAWNGQWKSATSAGDKAWFVEMKIPYTALGFSPKTGADWKVNFARERYATGIPQRVQWNRVIGGFSQVDKFATLQFASDSGAPAQATLTRYMADLLHNPLAIERPDAQFASLLEDKPGNYDVGSWYHGVYYSQYPKAWQADHPEEAFEKSRDQRLIDYAKAGFNGPPFPWVSPKQLEWSYIEKLHDLGMKFPYFMYSSAIDAWARKNHNAKWYAPTGSRKKVSITDPAAVETIKEVSERFFKENPTVADLLYCIDGIDEPSNSAYSTFSITKRPKMKAELVQLSNTIKAKFGYGKFGLYDSEDPVTASTPFERIAFWRWWSASAAKSLGELKTFYEKLAPGVPYMAFNVNATGALNMEDVARMAPSTDWVSSDPYPTKTQAKYSRARALYHTGFTTKIMADLGQKPVRIMPQLFVYYGGTPSPADIREWTSQAMKNGADAIKWYELGPANITIPKAFDEAMRVSKVLTDMNHLDVPTQSKTAILWANTTRWAQADKPMNAAYTLYTLLGEELGAWFNFVSDTQIDQDAAALNGYDVIYVPQLQYVKRSVATQLIDAVKKGKTLVVFDPNAFTWALDGTKITDLRQQAGGTALGGKKQAVRLSVAGSADIAGLKTGAALPLTAVAGRVGSGQIEAYEFGKLPAGAVVLATYADGAPAAYRVKVGKGAVVWFAAQPFGNADLAIKDSSWQVFLKSLEQQAGEKLNLPIWDFLIPAAKE